MRSSAVSVLHCLAVAVLSLVAVNLSLGQSNRGSIAGSVVDSTGGAVAAAEVKATEMDTGTVYTVYTTSTGAYRIPEILIGRYRVTVTAKGFKVTDDSGVVVQISTTTALDVTLQPGDVMETVTVVSDAPTLQTESADIGTVIGNKQVQELPLAIATSGQGFIRSPEAFIFLSPGSVGPGTTGDHSAAGTFETKISGGQNFGTEVILDGASIQRVDTVSAFTQIAPSVEAVSEFKITTSSISSAYGRTSGGVQAYSTRSGSNAFHGAAFEIFKNDKLDANSWYNNWVGAPKPRDHKNNYGGTFGGPVWIPKVYNGKDKTFFFFSWEQYRENKGQTVTSTLPTMAERQGDFSALVGGPELDPATKSPILNPCDNNNPVLIGQIFDPTTTTTVGGKQCRKPFTGNMIPTGMFSGVDQKVLGYLPSLPTNAPLVNNFVYTASNANLDTAWTARIDQNLGSNNKLFFSYNIRDYHAPNGASNLPGPLNNNYLNTYHTTLMRFGWDSVLDPSVLNHFSAGLNRIDQHSTGASVTGVDWDKVLGIGNASGQVFPQFGFSGNPVGIGYVGFSTPQNNGDLPNSLVLADAATWMHGRHSLQIGVEERVFQFSVVNEAYTSPSYGFNNYQTSFSPNDIYTGDPFASYILGAPQSETLTVYSLYPRWNYNYFAVFAQDDIKWSRSLTINLGLRWDVDSPRTEAHNAQSNLSLTAINPGTPGQPGALVYGVYAPLGNTYFKDFAPRIGFAFAPDSLFGIKNFVVRGGYSIYYSPLAYSDFGQSYTSGTTASPNFNSADNFTPQQSPDAGFPAYPAPSNSQDPTIQNGQSPSYVAPQYGKPGMVQNWNLEIQKQLAPDLILSLAYVGMHSTRLRSSLAQINNLTPQYYDLHGNVPASSTCPAGTYDPTVLNATYNSCTGAAALADLGIGVPSWLPGLYGGTPNVAQVLRPYPNFQSITTDNGLENVGQSTYNALFAKLERRFRNGLNLMASYTYSKTLTDADSNYPFFSTFASNIWGPANSFNLKANKAVSYQDIPQTFVISYIYELPVGPGKKWVDKGGVVGKIVGGWAVSGIQRYQSGAPTSIGCNATSIPANGGSICLDRTPGQSFLAPGAGSLNGPDQYLLLQKALAQNPSTAYGFGCNGQVLPPGASPYFNCAAFSDPNSPSNVAARGYAFGTMPRTVGNVRAPSFYNEDFSLIKRTSIYEHHAIIFRADLFNAFNRHSFAPPDAYWNDTTFGIPGGGGSGMILNAPKALQLSLRYEF
jgi:hypothetical protein